MHPVLLALVAAVLFGASIPASKFLLAGFTPFQLAGLLYLGAAIGIAPFAFRDLRSGPPSRLDAASRRRLLGAVLLGGVLGPILLLLALRVASAATVALLLNLELVATALLGAAVFRENLGARTWTGAAAVVAAGAMLSVGAGAPGLAAGVLTAGACLCWGLDNHLTALLDAIPPARTTFWKGAVAGATNLAIGTFAAPFHPSARDFLSALVVGAFSYGASIALYISAAQQLGATRAQAVFASAPFFGTLLSLLLLKESLGGLRNLSTWMRQDDVEFTVERPRGPEGPPKPFLPRRQV